MGRVLEVSQVTFSTQVRSPEATVGLHPSGSPPQPHGGPFDAPLQQRPHDSRPIDDWLRPSLRPRIDGRIRSIIVPVPWVSLGWVSPMVMGLWANLGGLSGWDG